MQQQQSQFRSNHSSSPSLPPSLPVFQQQTQPLPAIPPVTPLPESLIEAQPLPLIGGHQVRLLSKKGLSRVVAVLLTLLLAGAIFVIWFATPGTPPPSTSISQQSFTSSSQTPGAGTPTGGALHVYVIGSVRHPGVYTLPAGARVYQLIQAAGGALPQADLVSLNLAAPLTDGQEVYVLAVGETPPTYLGGVPGPGTNGTATTTQGGQLVNLNTATADEMRTVLHVSSTTAQKIIAARPYTSVDQLLQVVSRSIYDKIKNSVTV